MKKPVITQVCVLIAAKDLSDLLYILYSIGDDHKRWLEFINRLTTVTASDGVALVTHDLRSGVAQGLWSAYDQTESDRFLQHYSRVNPWIPKENPSIATGGTVTNGDTFMPLHKMRRTEFYNDWGRKNDVVYSIGVNLGVTGGYLRYVCLNRGERTGPSSPKAMAIMELLVPHLLQADRLQEMLAELGDLKHLLSSLRFPVFVLDRDGKVLEASEPARKLRMPPHGVSLPTEIAALEKAAPAPLRMLRLPETGSAALLMRATGLYGVSTTRYLFVLLDTATDEGQPLTAASQLYRLTPAETRFVQTLLRTGSLDLTLDELKVTRNTGRSQMRSIFSKTGMRRQGQVIQLFSLLGRVSPR